MSLKVAIVNIGLYGDQMSSPSTKPYHHGDLRAALIDAAIEEIGHNGATSLSLRGLARKIGVTHTAAYRHFRDRDDVLAAIAEQGFIQLGNAMRTAAEAQRPDVMAMMRATGVVYIDFAVAQPHHMQVMFGDLIRDRTKYATLRSAARENADFLTGLVGQAKLEGRYRDTNDRLMALASWAQVHGLAMLLSSGVVEGVAGDRPDRAAVVSAVLDLLRDGLAMPAQ